MIYALREIQAKMFPQLMKVLLDIRQDAFRINQYHYFRYKFFSVSVKDVAADNGKPEHLFPKTKAYLDEMCTPELQAQYDTMEKMMQYLTNHSLKFINPDAVLYLVPENFHTVSYTLLSQKDRNTLAQIKETPEYQEFLTQCLFIQWGAI